MSTANNKISMVVTKFACYQPEKFSNVYRIRGYPWRLRVTKDAKQDKKLSVICDKSKEAELWECTAKIKFGPPFNYEEDHTFKSWDTDSHIFTTKRRKFRISKGASLEVEIMIQEDGESWTRRSYFNPAEPRNGTLVVGEEKKKIQVNKEYLSSQSPFFDRLFNGNFKEKNLNEIPIEDVDFEEFSDILKLVCGEREVFLTDENVHGILELAVRFCFKIVEDKVVSYLLSSSCSIAFQRKLLLSEQFNISFLKKTLMCCNEVPLMWKLCVSSDWDLLSEQTCKALFKATCDRQYWYCSDMTNNEENPNIVISPPPAKKSRGSNTISMEFKWEDGEHERFSPVHRINGYNWQLQINRDCVATQKFKFVSWDCASHKNFVKYIDEDHIEVQIETEEDGESWRIRPMLGPLEPRDGILVIGEEKKRIAVDKQSLALASPFFDRLFNGDFMEKNSNEIPIRDVSYEEFSNLIMIIYQFEGASLTDANVHNVLQLADRFDLKIVQDYVVNFLLKDSRLSLLQKLTICEEYSLCYCRTVLLDQYHTGPELKMLCNSREFNDLPKETIRALFEKMCASFGYKV